MISGFNTDVEYAGTTYHIQTEDKGLASRLIVSLVYNKGTILASKRSPYDDLVNGDLNEKELSERLSRQHKLICAAVKAGRIDDLIKMQRRPAVSDTPVEAAVHTTAEQAATEIVSTISEVIEKQAEQIPAAIPETIQQPVSAPISEPEPISRPSGLDLNGETFSEPEIEFVLDDLIIEDVEILDDEILPSEAVEVVSDLSGRSRPANQKLSVELVGEQTFRGGDRRTVTLLVCRGTDRRVVEEAQIVIKILGSTFRPVIFHSRSDRNGLAKVHFEIPQFKAGRAALYIRVMSDGDEVELRRVVTVGT